MTKISLELRRRWNVGRWHVLPMLAWSAASTAALWGALVAAQTVPVLAVVAILLAGSALALLQRSAGAAVAGLKGQDCEPASGVSAALLGAAGTVLLLVCWLVGTSGLAAATATGSPIWYLSVAAAGGVALSTPAATAVITASNGAGIPVRAFSRAVARGAVRARSVLVAILAFAAAGAIVLVHPAALVLAPPLVALVIAAAASPAESRPSIAPAVTAPER